MAIREDGRPTLASWPKRLYDWHELPGPFQPALAEWRDQGLPPGNVTYIPRVHQHTSGVEYVTAWRGEEVLLLTARMGKVERRKIRSGAVAGVRYTVQLLRCGVEVTLDQPEGPAQAGFFYNKTKEDQLLPVLNLLLGNTPDFCPRQAHPETLALSRLREDSFAMYHTAKLCYRFGEPIREQLWLQGRSYGLQRFRKQKPEYFLALLDRGAAAIRTDFYGSEVVYLAWRQIRDVGVREAGFPGPGPRRRPALVLKTALGEDLAVPLLSGQEQAAAAFGKRAAGFLGGVAAEKGGQP